jgi:hypothetical protein
VAPSAGREREVAATSVFQDPAATTVPRVQLDDVVGAVRQLEREAASAVERFEQAGGRPSVQAFLGLARQLQGGIVSREDMDALLKQLPTVCRLLELEQQLIDMLATRVSHGPR